MIQPRNDYVLIERIDKQKKGRIFIPEMARERGIAGVVRAVGPGRWIEGIDGGMVRRTPEVKPGDTVLFNSRWNDLGDNHERVGYQFIDNLHLVREADIYCRIDA